MMRRLLACLMFVLLLIAPARAELLASGSVSNAATLDIDFTAYVSYRRITVYLYDVVMQNDGACIDFMTSGNGGTSWDNAAGQYEWALAETYDGNPAQGYWATTASHGYLDFQGRLTSRIGSASGATAAIRLTFYNPGGNSRWHVMDSTAVTHYTDGKLTTYYGSATRKSTAPITAVRLRGANNDNSGAVNGNISASYEVHGE